MTAPMFPLLKQRAPTMWAATLEVNLDSLVSMKALLDLSFRTFVSRLSVFTLRQ